MTYVMMTYARYLVEVAKYQAKYMPLGQRQGQCYFNMLHEVRPDLANQIRGNVELDPFYVDARIGNFLAWVCNNWDNKE